MTTKNFPPGTQIVTLVNVAYKNGVIKKGSVGVVIAESVRRDRPHKNVRTKQTVFVRLPCGRSVVFLPEEISPQRASFREEHSEVDLVPDQIKSYIAFEFIVGSTAYGLNTESSDEDVVGGFVLPTKMLLGLKNYKDTIVKHDPDASYHEIKKLIHLACKGNPNVIELGEVSKIHSLVKRKPTDELICELFERWVANCQ